jgi:hypothetical protein
MCSRGTQALGWLHDNRKEKNTELRVGQVLKCGKGLGWEICAQ